MSAPFRTCYRHPDQPAGVICQRCDRPICPQCMRQASVGFHCPECAHSGRQRVYTARSIHALNQPVAALALIALNVAVFVAAYLVPGGLTRVLNDGGLIAKGVQVHAGGSVSLVGVAHGQWWRIITSGFLHFGVFHIVVNMIALWVLGQLCEQLVGKWRFVLVYAVSLLAGSFGGMLVSPNALGAGASGAIFGLFGLLLVAARARGVDLRQTGLLTWLVINLIITFLVPGISVGAHLGGLVGGAVAAVAVIELPARLAIRDSRRRDLVGGLVAVGIGALCFAGALASASAGGAHFVRLS